jgi:hypothetical protein
MFYPPLFFITVQGFRVQRFRVNELAIFYMFSLSTSATARLSYDDKKRNCGHSDQD